MARSAAGEASGLSERLGVALTCQSLELEDGCPVSRGGRLAHLAEESFPGFALQYASRAEEVGGILAYSKLLWRHHQGLDGGETRERFGILNECDQKARMLFRCCFDWIVGDDGC